MAKRDMSDRELLTQLVDLTRRLAERRTAPPKEGERARPGPKPSKRPIDWDLDTKVCPHCHEEKPVKAFGRRSTYVRGQHIERVQPWCGVCRATTSENYRRGTKRRA